MIADLDKWAGIEAKIKDSKADTIQKILDAQG